MKKKTQYIVIALLIILVLGVSVNVANAQLKDAVTSIVSGYLEYSMRTTSGLIAMLGYLMMSLMGMLLSIAGVLLNVAMYLTTHLGTFIDRAPVVYTVWTIIRDLSSTLLIFFILYAAIRMILGIKQANYNELIKQIIIVGILINFSFFFARVLIDLSNVVSLQFYNAIAPTNTTALQDQIDPTNVTSLVSNLRTSGGVSDIIMGSLQLDKFWSSNGTKLKDLLSGNEVMANINILVLEAAGIFVVAMTIINFLVIAMACVARVAILIFLLGFSPVWIAAMAMPELKPFSDKWMGYFKSQLLFLPVYLAFLYVALLVISKSNLTDMITSQSNGGDVWTSTINLIVGFGIIIVLINIPFIVAVQVAGSSLGFIDKAYKSMTGKVNSWARAATVGAAAGTAGWAARKYIGGGAASLDKKLANNRFFGATVLGRDIRAGTVGALAKSKFGTSRSSEDYAKESKVASQQGKIISRRTSLERLIASHAITPALYNNEIKSMNEKEKLALGEKILSNIDVAKHLKSSDFDAIKKSDDFTDEERKKISDAREDALKHAISEKQSDEIKFMINNSDEKDLLKLSSAELESDQFVEHLTPGMLKKLSDAGIPADTKKKIGNKIRDWNAPVGGIAPRLKAHNASSFILKPQNVTEWTT